MIGQGGAEYGVRGFLGAYDAQTGKLAWKFYVMPGDPAKGFEDEALAAAAKTWNGQWWKVRRRRHAVGRHCLRSRAESRLRRHRQRLAVERATTAAPAAATTCTSRRSSRSNADTGKYVWHYQTTPGDNWDYNAAQPMILADLTIGNQTRKVIMQAPKNGFFYVLDRDDRQVDLGRAVCLHVVGDGDRQGDGPPDRNRSRRAIASRRCACRRRRSARITGRRWRSTR